MHESLVEVLRSRAAERGDARVFTFLTDGEEEETSLSYAELDVRARSVAAEIQARGLGGERILLLYPPCLDFVVAFFACLYAGAVAVPAYPPNPARLNKTLPRLRAIANDSQCRAILSTEAICTMASSLAEMAPEFGQMIWLASDDTSLTAQALWRETRPSSDDVAFLQYTSGSTGQPKGVVLSHANLLHNAEAARRSFGHDERLVMVSWLPLYHDMGLIGGMLQPIYNGGTGVLMSPMHFLQNPYRWLRAITRYQGTTSGAPNFAYDLCTRKVTEAQCATLILSSWEVAFNGAEPIRADTMDRFAKRFEVCGFKRSSFLPCYGLAEGTLLVAGERDATGPHTLSVSDAALGEARVVPEEGDAARVLVSCGHAVIDETIAIVDPELRKRCAPGHVGEIWVSSPSVARGYLRRDEESAATFAARLEDSPLSFLRTGDLGFFGPSGDLFIAARLKDLIILRGRNFYPHDLERSAEDCHPGMRPGCAAAFTIDVGGEPRLVIVAEFDERQLLPPSTRTLGESAGSPQELEDVAHAVRDAIGEEHELPTYAIVLIKPGEMPKTSSGKVMRRQSRQMYLANEFETVHVWTVSAAALKSIMPTGASVMPPPTAEHTAVEISKWLCDVIGELLGHAVSTKKTFASYAIDSTAAVRLAQRLSRWLGRTISPTVFWDFPTIEQLANSLASPPPVLRQPEATMTNVLRSLDVDAAKRLLDEVDSLTDAEVEAALRRRG